MEPLSGPAELEALLEEARAAERGAQRDRARQCYEAVLEALPEGGGALGAAVVRWIGRTYLDDGDLVAAHGHVERSLGMARDAGDPLNQARSTNLLGAIAQVRGDFEAAERYYAAAHRLAADVGDAELIAMIAQNRGVLAAIRGDYRTAVKHYRASLAEYRRLELAEHINSLLVNLGLLYRTVGRWRAAERTYAEVLESCRHSGNLSLQLLVESNLADLWIARADYPAAKRACDDAFRLAGRVGDTRILAEVHKHYGVVHRELGDPEAAETHLRRAAELAEAREDLLLAAETARELGELAFRTQQFQATLREFNRAHLLFTRMRARREVADIDARIDRLHARFLEIVQGWGESIESKDRYTQGHCQRVADYACSLASTIGFDEQTLLWFRMGALLHDVGKLAMPTELLNKAAGLTPDELAVMSRHPEAGVVLLDGIEFPWDIRPMVRHHHERWDGAGYPDGLEGTRIPLSARILTIADVYDALTTDRPYRPAFSHERAIEIMQRSRGRIFDPDLLDRFVQTRAWRASPGALAGPS